MPFLESTRYTATTMRPPAFAAKRSWKVSLVIGGFAILILVCSMPDAAAEAYTLGGFKARHFAAALFTLLIIGACWIGKPPRRKVWCLPSLLAITGYIAVLGLIYRTSQIFEWRFFYFDILVLCGAICGVTLTMYWRPAEVLRLVRAAYWLWLIALVLLSLALTLGMISPVWENNVRLHNEAMFDCFDGILYSIPLLFCGAGKQTKGWLLRWIAVGAAVVFQCNSVEGTRSVVVTLAASIILSLPLIFPKLSRPAVLLGGVGICCVGWVLLGAAETIDVTALERLRTTQPDREDRMQELQTLFQYLGNNWVTGVGAGVCFPSPIRYRYSDHNVNPHVSVLTSLQKGGVAAFIALIVVPLLTFAVKLVRRRTVLYQYCGAAVGLTYAIHGLLAPTGWDYVNLFYYGIALGFCFGPDPLVGRNQGSTVAIQEFEPMSVPTVNQLSTQSAHSGRQTPHSPPLRSDVRLADRGELSPSGGSRLHK